MKRNENNEQKVKTNEKNEQKLKKSEKNWTKWKQWTKSEKKLKTWEKTKQMHLFLFFAVFISWVSRQWDNLQLVFNWENVF